MITASLPPLVRTTPRASPGERLTSGLIVIGLHLALGYLALYLSVKNAVIELPPSISVRLLPMLEEKTSEPTKLPPPKPTPQANRVPSAPRPVLAVDSVALLAAPAIPPQPPAPPAQATAPSPLPAVIGARFDADYLHNPKPDYPAISRRNGEEGKVLLKVRVSAQGLALEVDVAKSSTYARLDRAAQAAVAQWRFVPARRGEEPLESSVLVPITFALE